MDTRSCAHHTCDQEFTTNRAIKRFCSERCRKASERLRRDTRNPEQLRQRVNRWKERNPEKVKGYRKDRYHSRTVPLGQRLQERLDDLFRAQAAVDPSRLPQLASRVLSWRPKGYIEIADYARNPYGPLEADWLYYAEMSPEEAVVVYARED